MMTTCTTTTWLYVIFTNVGPHELKYQKVSIGMLQKGILICFFDGYLARIMRHKMNSSSITTTKFACIDFKLFNYSTNK
jgi:hypothetical protein